MGLVKTRINNRYKEIKKQYIFYYFDVDLGVLSGVSSGVEPGVSCGVFVGVLSGVESGVMYSVDCGVGRRSIYHIDSFLL